jgi:murein DD-endopeptidase MepM/ murein hydrolase activator NlpD
LTNYGNHNDNEYDENYEYNLPFQISSKFKLYQGYNGTFSHTNQNALDFTMPIGTEITAIREGIVIRVTDKNNKNCEKEEC